MMSLAVIALIAGCGRDDNFLLARYATPTAHRLDA
jgi:hypothetical protein